MADYISRYTGEEIDERLAAVDGIIASLETLTEAIAASKSPYIGENGNWFAWDPEIGAYYDTQVAAQGPQGATGATGPQGPQGNTGSSVDYPYELVNNLTTDDATKGLTAAQGKVLAERIESRIARVAETGFFVVDENLYVGMKVDNDGVHAKNVFTTEIISQ